MKKIRIISFVLILGLMVCTTVKAQYMKVNGKIVKLKRNDLDTINKATYFYLIHHKNKKDTLFVNYLPNEAALQYSLIWKKDTINQILSYYKPSEFISPIGSLKWQNLFLIQEYGGDGCPSPYRLLAFKDLKKYFLSESFGNCNEIARIKYTYPFIRFYFDQMGTPNEYPYRKKVKYVYDHKKFSFKEEKIIKKRKH